MSISVGMPPRGLLISTLYSLPRAEHRPVWLSDRCYSMEFSRGLADPPTNNLQRIIITPTETKRVVWETRSKSPSLQCSIHLVHQHKSSGSHGGTISFPSALSRAFLRDTRVLTWRHQSDVLNRRPCNEVEFRSPQSGVTPKRVLFVCSVRGWPMENSFDVGEDITRREPPL